MCYMFNLDFSKAGSFLVEKKLEIEKPKKETQTEASVFTSLFFLSFSSWRSAPTDMTLLSIAGEVCVFSVLFD